MKVKQEANYKFLLDGAVNAYRGAFNNYIRLYIEYLKLFSVSSDGTMLVPDTGYENCKNKLKEAEDRLIAARVHMKDAQAEYACYLKRCAR